MAINFSAERMQQVIENHELWWKKQLGRPLVYIDVFDAHEPQVESPAPVLKQCNCHDFSVTPEQIIDGLEWELSQHEYYGDAYPRVNLDEFGPGVLAAFCGAKLDNSSGAVWFFAEEQKPISEVSAKYDPNNKWAKRIKDICRAGIERWNGSVIIGLPDFGGILDVAASLVGTEELLFACIEEPEEVSRLCKEIQVAWYEAYEDITKILEPQGCYTDWHGLLSKTPSYVLQNDFSAMISPNMFDEFALDLLRYDTERLDHTVYHLDGPDAIKHLDSLLTLEKLDVIQWVYGAGQPGPMHWLDLYKKIDAAGKYNNLNGSPEEILEALKHIPGNNPFIWNRLSKADSHFIEPLLNAK